MRIAQQFYNTQDLRRHAEGNTHFFSAGAMRFFNSRIGSNAYPCPNHPYRTVFVTSECADNFSGRTHPRLYTVHCYDCRTHDVGTIGKFQQYRSSRAANQAAKDAAQTIAATVEDWHEYALELNLDYDQSKRRAAHRGDSGFAIYGIGAMNNWVAI